MQMHQQIGYQAPQRGVIQQEDGNDIRSYLQRNVREPSPIEREVVMDTSTNHPFGRPDGGLSPGEIFPLEYAQEQIPQ